MDLHMQIHDDSTPPARPPSPHYREFQRRETDHTGISVAIDVHILERDDVIPGDMVCPIDGHLRQPAPMFRRAAGEAIHAAYTLVRLSFADCDVSLQKLDEHVGSIAWVPCVTQLYDCSWEMLVLRAYIPTLRYKLNDVHPSFTLDVEYDPFEPSLNDVELWGLHAARDLYADWTTKRARQVIQDSWYIASEYYSQLMDHQTGGRRRRLSWMGQGECLQSLWGGGETWMIESSLPLFPAAHGAAA